MRLKIWFALSLLLLSSCAHIQIPDTEWCGDMGDGKQTQGIAASCFHTLTDDTRDVSKDAWDAERFGEVCTTTNNFAAWKTAIEELCSLAGKRCTYAVKAALARLMSNANRLQAKAAR